MAMYKSQLRLNPSLGCAKSPFQAHLSCLHVFCSSLKATPCPLDKSRLVWPKEAQSWSVLPKIRYTLLGAVISALQSSAPLKGEGSLPPKLGFSHPRLSGATGQLGLAHSESRYTQPRAEMGLVIIKT